MVAHMLRQAFSVQVPSSSILLLCTISLIALMSCGTPSGLVSGTNSVFAEKYPGPCESYHITLAAEQPIKVTSVYTYDDDSGLLTSILTYLTLKRSTPSSEVHYEYDSEGKIAKEVLYEDGVTTEIITYVYDENAREIRRLWADYSSNEPSGLTELHYDQDSRVTEETLTAYSAEGEDSTWTIKHEYGDGKRRIQTIEQSNLKTYKYDTAGNLIVTYSRRADEPPFDAELFVYECWIGNPSQRKQDD